MVYRHISYNKNRQKIIYISVILLNTHMDLLSPHLLAHIFSYDPTYRRDVMANVIADINDGIGAAVLGIDGSDQWQYSRTVLFGIDWCQWNSICLRYSMNNR